MNIPLVLLPGFMLDETLWHEFRACLEQDTVTYPMRLAPGTTIEEIAQGIAHAAPQRFVLVGFSLGGYVARKMATLYPHRVAALVLVATSMRDDTESTKQSKRHTLAGMTAANFQGLSPRAIAKSLHPNRRHDHALVTRMRNMGKNLGYAALVVQSNLRRDGIATASISCPTLVVAAEQDCLRSMEESHELVAAIPDATLHVIEDCGHMVPLEQPAALADAVLAFVASLPNA